MANGRFTFCVTGVGKVWLCRQLMWGRELFFGGKERFYLVDKYGRFPNQRLNGHCLSKRNPVLFNLLAKGKDSIARGEPLLFAANDAAQH